MFPQVFQEKADISCYIQMFFVFLHPNHQSEDSNMALAIKAIPTLYGEEARRFQEMADETERRYDISPKRDITKDPRYLAMRTI